MNSFRQMRKSIIILVIVALSTFSIISAPVHAAMVNTAEVLKQNQHNLAKKRINVFLYRSEVSKQLADWGVNHEDAAAMVESLTDQEIEKLAARIDQLPAGGSTVGIIVGTGFVIFLVLLATDILGYTEIFPFVKR